MPGQYREVLLCVTGLTPQVVTETVYALARQPGERSGGPGVPDEVQVITTLEGRRRIELSLFSSHGGQGYFERLCSQYGLERERIRFDSDCIHVIRDQSGAPLADIVTEADNAAAADLINERVRALTRDDDIRVHLSLAGGRKTMGFYAGYALSLYGRPQDRLSHVLVNAPFESHPSFFYPPPEPSTLVLTGRNDYVSTADADVRLADIPFLRLRHELDATLLDGDLSFSDAVARAQQVLERPELRIDLSERVAWIHGHRVSLTPTAFLWMTWFARRAKEGRGATAFDEAAAVELMSIVEWLEGTGPSTVRGSVEEALGDLRKNGESNYFDRNRTRLNKALGEQSALHPAVVDRYRIHSFGRRTNLTYGLGLRPEQIYFEGEP